MEPNASTADHSSQRKKIRMDGNHSLADVAQKVCGDVRLLSLLEDFNANLPAAGLLPAGTIVMCPSKAEAASFAKKMGFTLGFDEQKKNGTDARRAFLKHQGVPSDPGRVDIEALARSMLARAMSPAEAGKRLARQCGDKELERLLASSDASLKQIALHTEAHALYPRALSRLTAVRNVLDATAKPAGLLALLEAIVRDAAAVDAVLLGCAVAPALRQALSEEAARVVALVARAREIAKLERGARDATLKCEAEGAVLGKLTAAIADGVDVLAGDRPAALDIENELDALKKHFDMVRGALKQAEDGLGRATAEIIRVVARGLDGAKLPRPWPLLASVAREVGRVVEDAPPTARDLGLGGILRRRLVPAVSSSPEAAVAGVRAGAAVLPRLTVADLAVRAASCARAVDEGDAFAERLAPIVAELFGLMRPPPAVDGGTPHARKARRRAAFDQAVSIAPGAQQRTAPQPEGVAALTADVVDRARLGGNAAAARLSKVQLAALLEAAKAVSSAQLTIHRQPMSELGRALVVAAMSLDREMGQGLLRPTGREAFVQCAVKHAGRVLSAACLALG